MKTATVIVSFLVLSQGAAQANPVTLRCQLYDNVARDFSFKPGSDRFIVIDSNQRTVRGAGVLLKAQWLDNEVVIEEPDLANPDPGLTGKLVTVIDRSTGDFVRRPYRRDRDGNVVEPYYLEKFSGKCELFKPKF